MYLCEGVHDVGSSSGDCLEVHTCMYLSWRGGWRRCVSRLSSSRGNLGAEEVQHPFHPLDSFKTVIERLAFEEIARDGDTFSRR